LEEDGSEGLCYNGADLATPVDECSDPHDVEVFAEASLDEDSDEPAFPFGQERVSGPTCRLRELPSCA
jgi:hypothetical protein